MLLPYYIASSNIEHFYYDAKGEYVQFENIVFTDTLELIEDPRRKDAQQKLDFFFNEANSDRAKRELKTDLFVIIGNPPYNASQENEDQNNKNTTNEIVDGRVSDTYAKSSNAQLKNKLYDPYVKFIRWASDRLNKQNGIVCFITNNSFLTDVQFDGMRQHLMDDFNRIYHFNLGGDVYLNPKLSGTKHNVFGIKVGVGITFLIRNNKYSDHKIYYHPLPEHLTRIEKEEVISEYQEKFENLTDIDWEEGFLSSSNSFSFDSSDIEAAKEYDEFIDLFNESEGNNDCIFKVKYPGINTARNEWVYSFSEEELEPRMKRTIHFYNDEVTRLEHYIQEKRVRNIGTVNLDKFVKIEVDKIKWSAGLKSHLRRLEKVKYSKDFIEKSAFRPFVDKLLYNQRIFVDRPSNFKTLNATDNLYLTFSGLGAKRVSAFITAISPNFDLLEKTQVFPLFEVKQKEEKGEPVIKIETNVTDWALGFFRAKCRDAKIKPEDIFYYVYGILHNTSFINHYSNLLKTTNPRIPLVANRFAEISGLGRKLAALHLNYNLEKPISLRLTKETLKTLTKNKKKIDYSIEKMKISRDKLILTYNNDLEYFIPKEAWGYEVNGRTPLEWIVDQYKDYQASSDEIIQLIERCITVTKKSQELIDELSTTKFKSKAQKIIAA
jgi:predicted helicase